MGGNRRVVSETTRASLPALRVGQIGMLLCREAPDAAQRPAAGSCGANRPSAMDGKVIRVLACNPLALLEASVFEGVRHGACLQLDVASCPSVRSLLPCDKKP